MAKHLSHQEVISFWFHELRPAQWFRVDQKIDQHITDRFEGLVDDTFHGRLFSWSSKPSSALALVLLFDQFPRHLWRGQAKAFSGDSRALSLSIEAERQGWIQNEPEQAKRQFWLMPRLHSEQIDVHTHALPLFERWTDTRTFALAKHYRQLIATHGRFPHRDGTRGEQDASNPRI
jgi:uncharacterized protein (DUF924 family)